MRKKRRSRRRERGIGEEEEKEEVKEVETPKSNVRNTTKAETRVKRYSRNAGERSERAERTGKIFGTLNSRYRKRDIAASDEITEESYAHFARAARSRQQFHIGLEIALSPPSPSPLSSVPSPSTCSVVCPPRSRVQHL